MDVYTRYMCISMILLGECDDFRSISEVSKSWTNHLVLAAVGGNMYMYLHCTGIQKQHPVDFDQRKKVHS